MADTISIVLRAEDQFSGVLGNFGSIITGIESAIHLAGDAFRFFKDSALEGLDAIASWERLSLTMESLVARELLATGQFNNMTDALDASSDKAAELLNWIQQLAINSPFTTEGVANAFRLSLAYGFTADEAQRLTEAMINFAAGTGASETVMSQIALALGQIEAKGKLAGQEVLQLVNAGLPVTQILADAFHVTTAEIEQMRTDGLLPAQEVIEAITTYLETNFAGAAERQALSWAGLKGTFEDIKQMGLREFFGGMFDVLQPLAVELSQFLQTEGMDNLREWGENLGALTQGFVNLISALSTGDTTAFFESFNSWFQNITGEEFSFSGLTNLLETAVNNVDWNAVSNALADGFSSINWEAIGSELSQGTSNVGAAIIVMVREIDWGAVLGAISEGLVQFTMGIIDSGADALIQGLADALTSGDVSELQSAFQEAWTFIFSGDFIPAMFETFYTLFANGVEEIKQRLIGVIMDGIDSGSFAEIGTNIVLGILSGITGMTGAMLINIGLMGLRVIDYFKDMFGIESPSTVFAEIGVNIILGLIGGFASMVGTLYAYISGIVSGILDIFEPVLNILGFDTGSTGTTGGRDMGGATNPTTGGASTVNFNFYGPVTINGVPGEGTYDCPPNIIIQGTSNQLVTAGF